MARTKSDRRPKWRRRAEARPDEVLDAALDLFIERGFSTTRVEDIAERAGVSKGTIYLYFPSKEEILKALVRRSIVPVVEGAAALARTAKGPPGEVLARMVAGVAGRISDPRLSAIPRIVLAEAGKFPELAQLYRREVIDRGLSALSSVIARGVETGEFRAVDPELSVRNVVGPIMVHMLLGTVFRQEGEHDIPIDRFIESHLDILMNGLAGPGTRG